MATHFEPALLSSMLPIYYSRLFPYNLFHRWLSYGGVDKNYFSHREFSYTLHDDIYVRYQSFSTEKEFREQILKDCPVKIDVGAVYSSRPKDHKTALSFVAKEKELIFDIDISDYDDVRPCCSGSDICLKCWPLMKIAILILDKALRDDFGFRHLLWIFSGRRGIHCWVCDEVARKLTSGVRGAIVDYLTVVSGGDKQKKKVSLRTPIHPSIKRASKIIKQHFAPLEIESFDFLSDPKRYDSVLQLISDATFRQQVAETYKLLNNSSERWQALRELKKAKICSEKNPSTACINAMKEIRLQYCYPRLDKHVSIAVNHLLKSPFCVHPKTGRVCVPIDIEKLDDFDPFKVPTLNELLAELSSSSGGPPDGESQPKKSKDIKNTRLWESYKLLERFIEQMEVEWRSEKRENEDSKMEF